MIPSKDLVNILESTSQSMITILEHKQEYCVHLKTGECWRKEDGTYERAFPFLTSIYGKAQVIEICYKKAQQHAKTLGWKK